MSTAEKLLTAEEFMRLPESIEGGKMELVEGKVITMCPVGFEHGELAATIYDALKTFVRSHSLGSVVQETGFKLASSPDLVRAPDVSFVLQKRVPVGAARRRFVEGPPDLAVEVVSPGDLDSDVHRKVNEYIAAGAGRVWVVRPEGKTVSVHRPGGTARVFAPGDTLTSDDAGFAADGFALALSELFA
jgi:Uma2 family endonuclease